VSRAHAEDVERVAADEGRRCELRDAVDHEVHPAGAGHGEHPVEEVRPLRALLVIRYALVQDQTKSRSGS
jgi:hypothetical protein